MRKIAAELREFGDLKLAKTPPTRGRRTLDLIFTNFPDMVRSVGILPPLFSHQGVESDHFAVQVSARIPRVEQYTVQKYSYVKQTPEGDIKFAEHLRCADLDQIVRQPNTDCMAERLHDLFREGIEKCYELRTTTRKSNQPQWINEHVLKLIAWRRAVFRREGRSCLLYTSPSPRDRQKSRMPSSA